MALWIVRIAWHEGPLQVVGQQLARDTDPFDLVDMSNILNLEALDDARAIIEGVKKAVRPGGALLCRASLDQSPGTLARAFTECGMDVEENLSDRAREAESSFLHNEVCVATTR